MNDRLKKQLDFILEIDAGDTYAYDTEGLKTQQAHGVTASQVYGRQRKTRIGSETLFELTDAILQEQIRKGNLPEE